MHHVSGFGRPLSLSFSSLTKQGCRAPSRNLSEEKINQKTYYDIEKRGELLAAPDRADEWGEELTEMGKWQRTNVRPPPALHIIFCDMFFIYLYLKWQKPPTAPCLCARAIRAHCAGACNVDCGAKFPLPTLSKHRLHNCGSFSLYRAHFTCRVPGERYFSQVMCCMCC